MIKKEKEGVLIEGIKSSSAIIQDIRNEISKVLVGQDEIVNSLIRGILCNGHVLVEGVPGIAKTLAVRALGKATGCETNRIQFTVDLLPTDIVGLTTYTPGKGFETIKGPIFANFLIADEINRSPPKCVLGDTPIITDKGEILDISEIMKEYSSDNIKASNNEFWIKPKQPLKLMALDLRDYKIKPEEVDYLYKQRTKAPYFDVELKTGRKIKVSPVHPFFTLKNGRVETIPAEELKENDCVLVPRKLNLEFEDELNYEKSYINASNKVLNEIKRREKLYFEINELKNQNLSKKEIATKLGMLESDGLLNTFMKIKPGYFKYIKGDYFFSESRQFGQVSCVKMPSKCSKGLAQFMAILISEGCINGSCFYLTMKDKEIPELFIKLAYELFGIEARLLFDYKRKQYRVAFRSDALVSLLNALGFKTNRKSIDKEIPQFILKSSDDIACEFLRLYYEGDGCASRDCIKVTTKSAKIANGLSYLLLRLGFVAKINHELAKTYIGNYKYYRRFYNLRLYGGSLSEFYEKIGFFSENKNKKLKSLIRNFSGEKNDLIPEMHRMIRAMRKISNITHKEFFSETGMHAHNVENPNNALMISRHRLSKIAKLSLMNNYLIEQLNKIIDSDFSCDFVKKAEKIYPNEDYWLYDFSMKNNHSFIAGFGGIISHNTQSALLEAMQEGIVTIGKETYKLPEPFFVMATQNPLETSGVYILPEAQVDRFLFKILMGYPKKEQEVEILEKNITSKRFEEYNIKPITNPKKLIEMQKIAKRIYINDEVKSYIVDIVNATREKNFDLGRYIDFGGSPRASIGLFIASKAEAMIKGRDFVTPIDVKKVCSDVLRHMIILNYEGQVEGITSDKVVEEILKIIPAP
jgi:MoxR-like ATPase